MTNQIIVAAGVLLAFASAASAQTKPTQAEIEQWNKNMNSSVIDSYPSKKATWQVENEQKVSTELPKQPIRYALGWWGRGFIEGAIYMIGGDKAEKKAAEFGLSVEVVAAHITTYCYSHQAETPFDAVQDLLLKVVK